MYKNHIGGGSSDLYCILCGGPTYSRRIISNIDLLKKYLNIKNLKINDSNNYYNVNPNGIWEHSDNIIEYIKKKNKKMDINDYNILCKSVIIPKNHKWQNDLIMITENKIIKKVKSSYGEAHTVINGEVYDPPGLYGNIMGHLAHSDCYKLLSTKYGKFTFNDIKKSIYNTNYGIINKYHGQFFYSPLAFLENPYLLESPLKNNINKNRILKLKLSINKKSDKKITIERPSPSESATLFKVGTKKKGNDGNMWEIILTSSGIHKWKKISTKKEK